MFLSTLTVRAYISQLGDLSLIPSQSHYKNFKIWYSQLPFIEMTFNIKATVWRSS